MTFQISASTENPTALRVPALRDCVEPGDGAVTLMYDSTLRRPLRLRDQQGVKLAAETHTLVRGVIDGLDALLPPLNLDYVRATLRCRAHDLGQPLDGYRLMCMLRRLTAYAGAFEPLEEVELELRPSLRVHAGDGGRHGVEADLQIALGDPLAADPDVAAALDLYSEWARRSWQQCVRTALGPWALASGITELRLLGRYRPGRVPAQNAETGATVTELEARVSRH